MKKAVLLIISFAFIATSFFVMLFTNILRVNVYSSTFLSDGKYNDYYENGISYFFGSKNFDNSHSFLGLLVFALFVILILGFAIMIILNNKKSAKFIILCLLIIGLINYLLLSFASFSHIMAIKNQYFKDTLNTFISTYSVSVAYHIVIVLLALGLGFGLLYLMNQKIGFKLNVSTIVNLVAVLVLVLSTIIILSSTVTLINRLSQAEIQISASQEIFGLLAIDDRNEVASIGFLSIGYLVGIISILLHTICALTNINGKPKIFIVTCQSMLGLFYGISLLAPLAHYNNDHIVSNGWLIFGCLVICASITSLVLNIINIDLGKVDNKEIE